MTRSSPTLSLAVLGLTSLLACIGCQSPSRKIGTGGDADQAAKAFYTILRTESIRGLPTDAQLTRLRPRLTEQLHSAICRAQQEQDAYRKRFPDDKPPWIEGDLFSSLFEGPTSWRMGEAVLQGGGDRAEVPVHLQYEDGTKPVKWTDVVLLVRQKESWRVADIRMGGDWAFKAGAASLLQTLSQEP